ncbi:MAG TPA: aminotransferase class IV [Planctomicrobium sp.]|nr:aminotransferase class IV [Planctomicrobium sp.]
MTSTGSEWIASFNGELIPFVDARLPVFDLGVMQGATVTERMRTVRHQPYLVPEHLERLQKSLQAIGVSLPASGESLSLESLERTIHEVAARNCRFLHSEDDLAVVVFVTAGQSLGDANGLIEQSRPTLCVYSAPLPWKLWNTWFEHGVSLQIPGVRQIPTDSISPHIKHRSRLNWHLADQEVKKIDAGAQALLLDSEGFVTETSSGNLFVVRNGTLFTPSASTTLPGISQAYVIELAQRNGVKSKRANLTPEDVANADEAFLTSSTYCLVPVSSINGIPMRSAAAGTVSGPMTARLTDLWSKELGLSFVEQVHSMRHLL